MPYPTQGIKWAESSGKTLSSLLTRNALSVPIREEYSREFYKFFYSSKIQVMTRSLVSIGAVCSAPKYLVIFLVFGDFGAESLLFGACQRILETTFYCICSSKIDALRDQITGES
jgi:hypothetical protein